ncbi:adenosylcobinamide-GDP ribazoletransferase [Corynebacterium pacaense]|uniref:adenosylcobinamide-GDP ribazoletransferase n=1 Tax=Corynebacterium pacaense TaxID=1816684 RepID=UPI0009BC434F|nr:adenosylcobinamide-GDP ribazoletransferase [Corynebacterium pacaense]
MSGKGRFQEGEHGPAVVEGVTTALSWLSILPFSGASAFDRITGARVMASIPVVGMVFGVFTAIVLGLLNLAGVPSLLCATLTVVMWELLNRMMHLDGLADVGDALGSYAPPARAREILADPQTGLIGFSAALFSLLVQIASVSALIDTSSAWMVCFIPAYCRLGGQVLARSGRRPLSPTGFGAMLIGTVRPWWILAWWAGLGAISTATAMLLGQSGTFWIPAAAALVICLVSEVLGRHFSRRFDGVNGDCIGACVHISAAVAAAVCALGASIVSL